MFIIINNTPTNTSSISNFKTIDQKQENSDGTYTDVYKITFFMNNSQTMDEVFLDKSDRDKKYQELVNKLVSE